MLKIVKISIILYPKTLKNGLYPSWAWGENNFVSHLSDTPTTQCTQCYKVYCDAATGYENCYVGRSGLRAPTNYYVHLARNNFVSL